MNSTTVLLTVSLAWLVWWISRGIYNLYLHPLARFPGPSAAAFSGLYRTWIEVVVHGSFVHTLEKLHEQYGEIVRVGPNELHFSRPETYHEIYNPLNRWDKEETLYHSFGEDRSTFGFLKYDEARNRKDLLSRCFSKAAIQDAEAIIKENVENLCTSIENLGDESVDLFYAYRCMALDVITSLCFGNSVNAVNAPHHAAPFVVAMDASMAVFARFKHAPWYKSMILNCPPELSKIINPAVSGLIDLQTMLRNQIATLTSDPESLKRLPHSTTIYHQLLSPESYRNKQVPDAGSLYDETQALMFGGADTTGTTLMHGTFHILSIPSVYKKLNAELKQVWPNLEEPPTLSSLEKLPYLTSVIKESMRISPGVASPLPRVVPASGATLAGKFVPGGTVVEMSSHFVHRNEDIFENNHIFDPNRWEDANRQNLDKWLVNFSRGPRSCLGLNLAWAELYLTYTYIFRKFDVEIDASSPKELIWRDRFLPEYLGPHLKAKLIPSMT